MTVYVAADFLRALTEPNHPYGEQAERMLATRTVVTSPLAYLELLVDAESDEFNAVKLIAHLLDVVPVATDEDEQIVLKAANYYDEGMAPFRAFHAATAETRSVPLVSTTVGHDTLGPKQVLLSD